MDKTEKKRRILKITGLIVAAAGLAAAIAGFADMGVSVANGRFPRLFFLLIIGLPCLAIGGMIAMFGFRAGLIKSAVRDITPAVKELTEAVSPFAEEPVEILCPRCKAVNRSDSVFCYKCGAALCRTCPECGKTAEPEDEYCTRCGRKL